MLVTAIVFTYLLLVSIIPMIGFVAWDVVEAASYKTNSFLDRVFRKVPTEQYFQFVVLPLCGAIAGGLISTAFAIFVDHPVWKSNKTYLGLGLIVIGLIVIAVGPLSVHAMYANPKKLIIGTRIDQLKDGDWTRDSKDDVIKAIDKQQAAITKKLNTRSTWFRTFLVLAIVSGVGWLVLISVKHGISSIVIPMLVIAVIILCGIVGAILDAAKVLAKWASGPGLLSNGGQ